MQHFTPDAVGVRRTDLGPLTPVRAPEAGGVAALPDDLHAALFADDGEATFVVLDGAKVMFLPALLETTAAPCRELFRPRDGADVSAAAPVLARVTPKSRLLLTLCTNGPGDWHGWGKGAALFLRSRADIDAVAGHLRHFTWFADDAGTGHLFRFNDPAVFEPYSLEARAECAAGLFGAGDGGVSRYILQRGDGMWIRLDHPNMPETVHRRIDRDAVHRLALNAAADRAYTALEERGVLDALALTEAQRRNIARHTVARFHPLGFRSTLHVRYLVAWALTLGPGFDGAAPGVAEVLEDRSRTTEDRFKDASDRIRAHFGRKMGALFGRNG
ncbi:MAG: DUF4123 domain-containing protein [Pseudomonadota bacterium]